MRSGAGHDLMKTENALPKGAVCAQYRTVAGRTYGPYWFRFWREGGRLRKAYVRAADLESIRTACLAARDERTRVAARRSEQKSERATLMRLLKELDALFKEGGDH